MKSLSTNKKIVLLVALVAAVVVIFIIVSNGGPRVTEQPAVSAGESQVQNQGLVLETSNTVDVDIKDDGGGKATTDSAVD
jgi:cell division protein FtsL